MTTVTIGLDTFDQYKDAINTALERLFAGFSGRFTVGLSKPSQVALERLREYSLRPGKRIRGSLGAAAYDEAKGTRLDENGIQLGVVLELMQNYLLIVDDVMDKSATRRGLPTVHELYSADPESSDLHEAQMMAVNVGEVAQHMANLVLADIAAPAELIQKTLHTLHTNILVTGFGQIDDLYQQLGREVSEADIMTKYRSKSSYYTFINPLQCGFTLAGKGGKATLDACVSFGLPAGVAFQLHDDELGLFGDTKTLGKPNLDDIREGKYTLLVQYALEHASAETTMELRAILGKADAAETDLRTVRRIMTDCGARRYVGEAAERQADAALAVLSSDTPWSPSFSELLKGLVEFSIKRDK